MIKFHTIRRILLRLDFWILCACLFLVTVGIFAIYSAGVSDEGVLLSNEYLKQILWAGTGLAIMLALALSNYRKIKDFTIIIYIACIIILIYTRIFGRVVNGAKSWIGIGDIGLQTSEFAKIAIILFLAHYLDISQHTQIFRRIAIALGIVLLPVMLILSQPDFGTSLVFFPILIFMLFIAGFKFRYIFFILGIAAGTSFFTILPLYIANFSKSSSPYLLVFYAPPYVYALLGLFLVVFILASLGYWRFKKSYYFWIGYIALIFVISIFASIFAHKVLKEYQIMRLIVFLDPTIDPRGSGWNILQSITAIGSGNFFGKGFLQGTQSHYRYLPQQSTDFIFSIIAEEGGLIGCLLIFAAMIIILWRCTVIIRESHDNFAVYITAGIMGMLFFHFMINVGMAMGIMPITGIPLFFLSYGGSSLWLAFISIGLVQSIAARRYYN